MANKSAWNKCDFSELFIDNEVRYLNENSLKDILRIVECLELCKGFQHDDCISLERKLIVKEKVTVNECSISSSKLHYRSELCEEVVSFISQSQSIMCKKCQKLKLNIEAKQKRKPIGVTTTKKMCIAISKPKEMNIHYHILKNIQALKTFQRNRLGIKM